MTKFKKSDVLEALEKIVESKPDGYNYGNVLWEQGVLDPSEPYDPYYTECEYTVGNAPACIVGQVYYALTGELIETNFGWLQAGGFQDEDAEPYRKQFTPAANKVLGLAQVWQDKGFVWTDALDKAKRGIEA